MRIFIIPEVFNVVWLCFANLLITFNTSLFLLISQTLSSSVHNILLLRLDGFLYAEIFKGVFFSDKMPPTRKSIEDYDSSTPDGRAKLSLLRNVSDEYYRVHLISSKVFFIEINFHNLRDSRAVRKS